MNNWIDSKLHGIFDRTWVRVTIISLAVLLSILNDPVFGYRFKKMYNEHLVQYVPEFITNWKL